VIEISRDLTFKICLFGEKDVGKSSLIQAVTQKGFSKETRPPAIIDIETKHLTINSFKTVLQIWILRFDFQFDFLFPIFLRGTSGGIFMFDITKFPSISNVERWITTFKKSLSNDRKKIPLVMVGGKCDLYFKRTIPEKYAEKISQKYEFFRYFECSSKTGENLGKVFKFLTRTIMKFNGYI